MARRRRRTVYGEPVEVLLDVLNALDPVDAQDAEETAAPRVSELQHNAVVRAMMRSEAALLRKDADRFPALDRSVDERRSVAMMLLAVDVVRTARRLGLLSSPAATGAEATRDARPPVERAAS